MTEKWKKSYLEKLDNKIFGFNYYQDFWDLDEFIDDFSEMMNNYGIDKSIEILKEKLLKNPEDIYSMNLLADSYLSAQNIEKTLKTLSLILSIEPDNIFAKNT